MFAALAVGMTLAWSGAPAEAAPAKTAKTASAKATPAKAKSAKSTTKKVAAAKPRKPAPLIPSASVAQVADWVISSGDSGELPFMVIDKVAAQVFVFEADGTLRGGAPALLGLAQGDNSVPGIGDRKLSAIRPGERTTPAGRFVANYGPAAGKSRVLWVDYASAISIHPVVTSNPKEQRLKRLASRSARDNRITFGCINVSAGFYENVVRRTFTGTRGVVYILPETEPLESVFPAAGGFHKAALEPRPNAFNEEKSVSADDHGAPAADVADNAPSVFDPIIELGTARALAAGDAASDAVESADAPPVEPDDFAADAEPASPEEAQTLVRMRPEPDRILELDYAASHDLDHAASDQDLYGPAR